ncbi:hypothetical protein SDC9_134920 [bioreactor metagenome]|uniref:Uncharacterized protein n=1 Tax=bioreactor metagenome TaxID=1076179 RepID=A0A645DED1_9ZZZZ
MLRRLAVQRRTVVHELLAVCVIGLVLRAEMVRRQIAKDVFTGGQHTVLISHGLPPLRVPPENLGVGPSIDPVHVVHAPGGDVGIGVRAASSVDVQRVVAQSQFYVIGTAGADTAQHPDAFPLQRLIERHHAGNAALRGDLVDDIRQRGSQLGLGGLQIVQHHRHGPQILIFRLHGKPCQRIRAGGNIGLWLLRDRRRVVGGRRGW